MEDVAIALNSRYLPKCCSANIVESIASWFSVATEFQLNLYDDAEG